MNTSVNNNNIETLMGATLVWPGASNLQGEYLLESYTKATKGKAELWLHDKASGHIITMDLSRRTLDDLQQTGEHRTDAGTTIRIKQDAERPLWISVDNGVAGDIFKDWGEAVSDLQRHVYNTLQGCCGCEIHRESATRYQAYFEDDDKWKVCEVVPFDPTKPDHREAYEAQRDRLGLPELITEAEGVKVGDKVKHVWSDEVATVTAIREAFTLYEPSGITDPDGRKFQDFETWNGKTVKAEDREKWTKFFAEAISNKVEFGGNESTYKHNAGKIRVKVAYTNDSDKPDDMSYCVSWYRWKDTESEKAEIVECENGVTIWQAARAMADFHLLADVVGFTSIDEILNPCDRPKAA